MDGAGEGAGEFLALSVENSDKEELMVNRPLKGKEEVRHRSSL